MTRTVAASADVRVRQVEPQLWREYRAVRLAMLLDLPAAYDSTFAREVAFTDEQWLERLEGATSWLAVDGQQPLGAVTLFQAPGQASDEAYLVAMWVAAHARGHGVADALVAALTQHAGTVGIRRVVLDVADANSRAVRFYERAGFVRTGRTGVLTHAPDITEFEMALLVGTVTAHSR
ncbi:GNAT family N-acetyltransferase [Pedococcus sp. 5OH_020]|uniref:GNAT family N-acetyltransferase n=1 Tax=Pedococcus sp. 5OH_020 TaxID=2989814 RepID=UPI0022E9AEC0|nr:GNAT family N-acetyltransferase [Pedococcus sp. 5OH_020]